MSSFSGTYSYTVDVKGRINFKKFLKRLSSDERLNSNYHLMRQSIESPDNKKKYPFFYIFTESSWQKFYDEKVEVLPTPTRLNFLSNLCGESSLDGSERLSLPKEFLEFIKAKKDLVLQGDGNRIQVWSKEEYDKYFSKIGEPDESMLDMFS
jgi:DNA-binding transcriptional regulator/RsmH inhibitor MraZ